LCCERRAFHPVVKYITFRRDLVWKSFADCSQIVARRDLWTHCLTMPPWGY
jgi:hypothetical protein